MPNAKTTANIITALFMVFIFYPEMIQYKYKIYLKRKKLIEKSRNSQNLNKFYQWALFIDDS